MASALARLNHNVKLICKDRKAPGDVVRRIGNGTLSIRRLGGYGRFNSLLHPFQGLFYGAKYIATSKIDVIYERTWLVEFGFLLSKFFRKPLVIAAQDLEYYDYANEKEIISRMVDSRLFARRKIDNRLLTNRFIMAILKKIRKINYKSATWIITVTPQVKQVICAQYNINPDKIIVLSNGADTDLFRPLEIKSTKILLKLDDEAQYVCYVGTLAFYEGVEYLIKSAPLILEKCSSARFLIVGDGPSKKELMNLTQQGGVYNKFTFTGAVPHEDVPKYINASEVCICTVVRDGKTRIAGTSGLKIFEYMACGKPVVVSDTEGSKDVVAESDAGLLVSPEHPNALASAIIKLLEDKELSQQLGENGRKAVIEKFDWARIAERVSELFDEAIKR